MGIKIGSQHKIECTHCMHRTIFDGYDNGTIVTVMDIDLSDNTVLVRAEGSHLTMWHDVDDLKDI